VTSPFWIGLIALAFGIMAGSLSLLCVFALETEGGQRELAPERGASDRGYAEVVAERRIPHPYAAAHPQQEGRLSV
jgi:hypothetical protein